MKTNHLAEKQKKNQIQGKSRKGFIFTLLALLVIAFMIIEIGIYFSAYQVRQESEPMKIRTRVVEEFAMQLSSVSVHKISRISAYNSVYALTRDSVSRPVASGKVSEVIGALVWNGTRSDTGSVLVQNGTILEWQNSTQTLADKIGISLNISCTDFKINQSDPWTVQVNYTFSYSMRDEFAKTNISDTYGVSVNVSIVGFEDPLFTNMTSGSYSRNIYPYSGTISAVKVFNADSNAKTSGRGWFYGEIFKGMSISLPSEINESDYNASNKFKILYTTNRLVVQDYGNMFGAVIYYGSDYASVGSYTSVPFIAISDSVGMPSIPLTALIRSGDDYSSDVANFTIYNIESIRNFVTCGYYALNPDAPSFFDRLSVGRPGIRTLPESFGIETSIVGSWASQSRSSIDHMYYDSMPGVKVMGLTGCKFYDMCRGTALPKFLVDSSHNSTYGLSEIICYGDNSARCG